MPDIDDNLEFKHGGPVAVYRDGCYSHVTRIDKLDPDWVTVGSNRYNRQTGHEDSRDGRYKIVAISEQVFSAERERGCIAASIQDGDFTDLTLDALKKIQEIIQDHGNIFVFRTAYKESE